jgi:hypothetical protein
VAVYGVRGPYGRRYPASESFATQTIDWIAASLEAGEAQIGVNL